MLALAAPVLAGLLGWTGAGKLTGPARNAALTELWHDERITRWALRTLGAVEILLALALAVHIPAAGYATAALGAGFVGYLAWARAVAPDAGCGCTAAQDEPITGRSFARAGLVLAGGVAVSMTDDRWWTALGDHPVAGPAVLLALSAAVVMLSTDRWLLASRRARLAVFGHPHAAGAADVPVPASVELLESSLAYHSAAGVVRSGLLEAWDDGGWRFLRYAGVADGRAVTVVFAVDATSTVDNVGEPAVRVTVVDDERQEILEAPFPVRTLLPLAD